MAAMISYLVTDDPAYYSVMVLITWINLLQYLRYFKYFRFFIDLIGTIFTDAETWKFLIVLTIMVCAFASAMILLNLQESCAYDDSEGCFSFVMQFKDFIYTSFGDFGASEDFIVDKTEQNATQWVIFGFAIFFMCIVMLNLLIGILSKTMENVLETQTQTEYAAICEISYDLEVFISARLWACCCRVSTIDNKN
jgi:hypothetical protein